MAHDYRGTVDLAAGVRPKNNGPWAMVDAKDVQVGDDPFDAQDRLPAVLNEKLTADDIDASLSDENKAANAKAVGDAIQNALNMAFSSYMYSTASGNPVSVADGAADVDAKSVNVAIPLTQEESGVYRNITGWTGLTVTSGGADMAAGLNYTPGNIDAEGVISTSTSYQYSDPVMVTGINSISTYVTKTTGSGGWRYRIHLYDQNDEWIRMAVDLGMTLPNRQLVGPIDVSDASYVRLMIINSATAEAYNSDVSTSQVEINWSSEPGAIGAGTLDITSGVLTVTHKYLSFTGDETRPNSAVSAWYPNSAASLNPYFCINLSEEQQTGDGHYETSSHFAANPGIGSNNGEEGFRVYYNTTYGERFICRPGSSITTNIDGWIAWLKQKAAGGTPLEVAYELMVPETYQLTPMQVKMLLGGNRISTNAGTVSITYPLDPTRAVDTSLSVRGRAADAKAVSDLVSALEATAVVPRTIIPAAANGGDLDNYTNPGLYYYITGNVPANAPNGSTGGLVAVFPCGPNFVAQFYYTTAATYFRFHNSTTWNGWIRYANDDKTVSDGNISIPEASAETPGDIDDYTTPGIYRYTNAPLHAPTTPNGAAINVAVVVVFTSNTYMAQVCYTADGIYYRRKLTASGAWGDWVRHAKDDNVVSVKRSLTASDNIDECVTTGIYYYTTLVNPGSGDLPSTRGGTVIVFAPNNTATLQMYISDIEMKCRYKTSTGWGPWMKLATESDAAYILSMVEMLFRSNTLDASEWANGSISPEDGTDGSGTTTARLRTVGYADACKRVSLEAGYAAVIHVFDENYEHIGIIQEDGSYNTSVTYWCTGDVDLTAVPYNYHLRILLRKDPQSSIAPEDGVNVKFIKNTDDSLSVPGMAADARATGEAIQEIMNALDSSAVNSSLDGMWHNSSIMSNTGVPSASYTANRLSSDAIPVPMMVEVEDGYTAAIYVYDNEGTYLGNYFGENDYRKTANQLSGTTDLSSVPNNYTVRFVMIHGNEDMDATDGENLRVLYYADPTLTKIGKPADAKATGDAITALRNDAVTVGTLLTDADDLNDITTPGIYRYSALTGRPANRPVDTGGMVLVFTNIFITQIYYSAVGVYYRFKASGDWSDWTEVTTGDKTVSVKGSIPGEANGGDLDDYKTPGMYSWASSLPPAHAPVSTSGTLIVLARTYVVQVYCVYNGSAVWYRAFGGTVWSEWAAMPLGSNTVTIKDVITRTDSGDNPISMNDIVTPGIYRYASGNVPLNVPTSKGGIVVVFANGSTLVTQIYYAAAASYYRFRDSTGWSNWTQFMTNTNTEAIQELPALYMTGDEAEIEAMLADKENKVKNMAYTFFGRTGTCECKMQGSSSVRYGKKNFTIKFDTAFDGNYEWWKYISARRRANGFTQSTINESDAANGVIYVNDRPAGDSSRTVRLWGEQKKFCTKANFIDPSHLRNVVNARLWGQIIKARTLLPNNNPAKITDLRAEAPNYGAIDGEPITIYMNGDPLGLYTLNIPKDKWTFAMGSGEHEYIIGGENNASNACRWKSTLGISDWSAVDAFDPTVSYSKNDYAIYDDTLYRYTSNTASVPKEWDGSGWDGVFAIEYEPDESTAGQIAALQSIDNAISVIQGVGDGWDADQNVLDVLDVDSVFDYIIFTLCVNNHDALARNILYGTYDGTKWFMSAYDLDTTFGTNAYGQYWYDIKNDRNQFAEAAEMNQLAYLMCKYSKERLRDRYHELRAGVLSEGNVFKELSNFGVFFSERNYAIDRNRWPQLPGSSTANIAQYMNYYRMHCEYLDDEIDNKLANY